MRTILSVDIDWVSNWTQSKQLLNILSPKIKNGEFKEIAIRSHHQEIRDVIDPIEDDEIYVVNIDHHHDIAYGEHCALDKPFQSCNWLGKYLIEGKVSSAIWIANPDSEVKPFGIPEDSINIYYDLELINEFNYDTLFICRSPHYIWQNPSAYGCLMALENLVNLYNID